MTNQSKLRVGLCLAGGGSKGIVQAGMLKAWKVLGLQYDALYSTSVGTCNGIPLHQGSSWETIQSFWMKVHNKDVFSHVWWNLKHLLNDRKPSLYDSAPLGRMLDSMLDYDKLVANPTPFTINTTNFTTGRPLSINAKAVSREALVKYALASASCPVFFPPVIMDGQTLYDGGVMNNFSLAMAVQDGMDVIVTMNFANPEPFEINNIVAPLEGTLANSMNGYFDRELGEIEVVNKILTSHDIADRRVIKVISIQPDKVLGFPLLDFEYKGMDRAGIIDYGYQLALPKLKELACLIG